MCFPKSVFLQALLLLLILTSCRTTGEQAAPSPTPQPLPTATEQATAPAATATAGPAATHPLAPTPANAATAFPGDRDEALIPLPGIVFENGQGTWLVEAGSGERLLTTHTGVEVSPDGKQGLICVDGDVVLLDFETGAETNLTQGSGRVHYSATWWPARPGTLVLTSVSPEEEGPNAGRLTLVETDGSNYRVVQAEREVGYSFPAPSPDGQTIAFDAALSGMLYRIDGTVEPFDPGDYRLPAGVEVVRMGSPAWSPDGKWLAWMLGLRGGPYGEGEVWDGVLGIFRPESRSVTLIHPFRPAGRGGWFRPPVWSGRWLAFDVESDDPAENGLWVTDPFGLVTRRLRPGAGYPVVWSPPGEEHWANGNTLVIARPGWRSKEDNWLLVSGGWKETALVLSGAVVDWLQPAGMAVVPAPAVVSDSEQKPPRTRGLLKQR